jgi:hypothetical protein
MTLGYPGYGWDDDKCPFHVIDGAFGWLLVDTRSDLIIATKSYGKDGSERELHREIIFRLATILNYGKLGVSVNVLDAIDVTP